MTERSNTAQKQQPPGIPFTKGDPRIWKHGRPKSFDALRSLAQEIAHETAKAGRNIVTIEGHAATVTEVIMRQWAQSKDPRLQQKFIEVAYGKVPDIVEVSGKDGSELPVVVLSADMLDKLKNE